MEVRYKSPCSILALIVLLSGCTTTLSGKPATKDTTGIRYSLPAPHIFLNPQPDGTVVVEVRYLPDPQNTYSLNLSSYLSTATFKVELVDGMLTQVSLDSDSSKIPAESVAAATELQKARMTAAEKAAEAKKQEADAEKAVIKTAAELIRAQEEKIALLEAKLAFAEKNPGTLEENAIRALKLEISQERVVLTQLQARLTSAQSGVAAVNAPGDAFMEPFRSDPELEVAYGPVLFRVLPEKGGVKLVAIEQQTYTTSSAAMALEAPKIEPEKIVVKAGDGKRTILLRASKSFKILAKKLFKPSAGTTAPAILEGDRIVLKPDESGSQLELLLPEDLPKGDYRLDLDIQADGEETKRLISVEIDWLVD